MFKRGQAQQFNWIFVSVVGIIILLFFLGFLVKYLDLQDSKNNAEIARSFSNSILASKGIEQYKNFSVSKSFRVDYDCQNLVVNQDQSFMLPVSLAMDSFETNKLVFWVEDYKRGFLVDRVVFVSDADVKYFFEDSSYLVNLPPNVNIANSIQEADVVVGSSGVNYPTKKDIFVGSGVIRFIDENREFNLGGDEFFVYLATFSNADVFECTRGKLEDSFDNLKQLYIYKIEQISLGNSCDYSAIRDALSLGNVEEFVRLNNNLANLGCEVVF